MHCYFNNYNSFSEGHPRKDKGNPGQKRWKMQSWPLSAWVNFGAAMTGARAGGVTPWQRPQSRKAGRGGGHVTTFEAKRAFTGSRETAPGEVERRRLPALPPPLPPPPRQRRRTPPPPRPAIPFRPRDPSLWPVLPRRLAVRLPEP